jgi:hypothetical protein
MWLSGLRVPVSAKPPIQRGSRCSLVVRFNARRVTSSSVRSLARASSAVRRFLKFGCSSPFNSSTVASERPGSDSVSHGSASRISEPTVLEQDLEIREDEEALGPKQHLEE